MVYIHNDDADKKVKDNGHSSKRWSVYIIELAVFDKKEHKKLSTRQKRALLDKAAVNTVVKIGVTSNCVQQRFSNGLWRFNVIAEYNFYGQHAKKRAYTLEQALHVMLIDYYKPTDLRNLGGNTECFDVSCLACLDRFLDNLDNNPALKFLVNAT